MSLPSSPVLVAAILRNIKEDLENVLGIATKWRKEGVNGSGMVPLEVISLEPKAAKLLQEVNNLITLVSLLETQQLRCQSGSTQLRRKV